MKSAPKSGWMAPVFLSAAFMASTLGHPSPLSPLLRRVGEEGEPRGAGWVRDAKEWVPGPQDTTSQDQQTQQDQQQQGQQPQDQSQQDQQNKKKKKKFFGGLKAISGEGGEETASTTTAGAKSVGEGKKIGAAVPSPADRQAVLTMENTSVSPADLKKFQQDGRLEPRH